MKLHRSIQYILEHPVRSVFPDSTVRQCKTDKSKLNNTEKKHYTKIPRVSPKMLYSFGWIISPLFDQLPCPNQIILNTEAKYSYMIDAVAKS